MEASSLSPPRDQKRGENEYRDPSKCTGRNNNFFPCLIRTIYQNQNQNPPTQHDDHQNTYTRVHNKHKNILHSSKEIFNKSKKEQ